MFRRDTYLNKNNYLMRNTDTSVGAASCTVIIITIISYICRNSGSTRDEKELEDRGLELHGVRL